MSEPEIARRCPTCGASIRQVALFCPQCGNSQPQLHARADAEPQTTSKKTAPLQDAEIAASERSMSDTIAIERPKETPETPARSPLMSPTIGIEKPDETPPAPAKPRSMSDTIAIERPGQKTGGGVRGAVGGQLRRANTIARGVEGDVIHRVQKVRQISSVVLEEAGDDPGLRFVLVAAIVFILFLVIVLLNKLV
ncbi:MAG TPA: zinc ribbon domain-containing protein [Pyrinomonadaceae bacterium]|jgi:hypothetical protein|nr:zinc ribbon domain-containing protein [Pyrinomonadaceae bacterium]